MRGRMEHRFTVYIGGFKADTITIGYNATIKLFGL